MRKIFLVSFIMLITGCVSTNIPIYIHDENPYKKDFYASYDAVVGATTQALKDLGWEISESSDPRIYEQNPVTDNAVSNQILLFTRVRQTALFLGSRYSKLNVYIRTIEEKSEVEIRYITVTSTPVKSFENYQNDRAVNVIFDRIQKNLEEGST